MQRARHMLGTPPSHGAWFSGIWAGGGTAGTGRVDSFGAWRGTPVDAATVYPEAAGWQQIHDSHWHITTFNGFDGTLTYGLPMLPDKGEGDLGSIVAGTHDWVYKKVAQDLVRRSAGVRSSGSVGRPTATGSVGPPPTTRPHSLLPPTGISRPYSALLRRTSSSTSTSPAARCSAARATGSTR